MNLSFKRYPGNFILASILIIFLLQFSGLGALRLPLVIGHIAALFFIKFNARKLDFLDFIYILLFFYVILQNIALQTEISIILFFQSLVSVSLYPLFYHYNRSVLNKVDSLPLRTLSTSILFLLPFFLISFESWSPTRSSGILGNPNVTAHVFITLIPFCLLIPHTRKYYLSISAIVLIGLVMFASRSALLSAFLGIVVYLITLRAESLGQRFFFNLLLQATAVYISFNAVNLMLDALSSYKFSFSDVDSRLLYTGYNGRDVLYDMALERLKGNEFWGLGFDASKFEGQSGQVLSTHNGFLEIFLRIGYIGSAIFIGLLIYMIKQISAVKNNYFRAAALMALTIILSLSTNSSTFFVFNYLFYYFIMIYCIVVFGQIKVWK